MEGSLRVPFIIRWPGHIPVGVSNEIVHCTDIFTTLALIGGAQLVSVYKGDTDVAFRSSH